MESHVGGGPGVKDDVSVHSHGGADAEPELLVPEASWMPWRSSAGGARQRRELRCYGGLPHAKEWRGRGGSSTEAQEEELRWIEGKQSSGGLWLDQWRDWVDLKTRKGFYDRG